MTKVIINKYIVADPKICHGKPTFKGTRVMVWQALEMFTKNQDVGMVLKAFPSLTTKHIQSALEYVTSLTKEGYVVINSHS